MAPGSSLHHFCAVLFITCVVSAIGSAPQAITPTTVADIADASGPLYGLKIHPSETYTLASDVNGKKLFLLDVRSLSASSTSTISANLIASAFPTFTFDVTFHPSGTYAILGEGYFTENNSARKIDLRAVTAETSSLVNAGTISQLASGPWVITVIFHPAGQYALIIHFTTHTIDYLDLVSVTPDSQAAIAPITISTAADGVNKPFMGDFHPSGDYALISFHDSGVARFNVIGISEASNVVPFTLTAGTLSLVRGISIHPCGLYALVAHGSGISYVDLTGVSATSTFTVTPSLLVSVDSGWSVAIHPSLNYALMSTNTAPKNRISKIDLTSISTDVCAPGSLLTPDVTTPPPPDSWLRASNNFRGTHALCPCIRAAVPAGGALTANTFALMLPSGGACSSDIAGPYAFPISWRRTGGARRTFSGTLQLPTTPSTTVLSVRGLHVSNARSTHWIVKIGVPGRLDSRNLANFCEFRISALGVPVGRNLGARRSLAPDPNVAEDGGDVLPSSDSAASPTLGTEISAAPGLPDLAAWLGLKQACGIVD